MNQILEYIKKLETWFDVSASWENGAIVIRLKPKIGK